MSEHPIQTLPKCDDVEKCNGHYEAIDDLCNLRIYCRNVKLALLLFHTHGREDDQDHLIHDVNGKIASLLKLFCQLNIQCLDGIKTVRGYLPIHCLAGELHRCFKFSCLWLRGEEKPTCQEAVQKNDQKKHLFWNCIESFIKAGMNPHVKNSPSVFIFNRHRTAFDIIFQREERSEIKKVYDAEFWLPIYNILKQP